MLTIIFGLLATFFCFGALLAFIIGGVGFLVFLAINKTMKKIKESNHVTTN